MRKPKLVWTKLLTHMYCGQGFFAGRFNLVKLNEPKCFTNWHLSWAWNDKSRSIMSIMRFNKLSSAQKVAKIIYDDWYDAKPFRFRKKSR